MHMASHLSSFKFEYVKGLHICLVSLTLDLHSRSWSISIGDVAKISIIVSVFILKDVLEVEMSIIIIGLI